jgi:hypothetical protein
MRSVSIKLMSAFVRSNRGYAPFLLSTLMSMGMVLGQVAVTTYHYDNTRAGVNANETILNTSNVKVNTFGKLFSRAVDGQIYAQPLYVPNVNIPGQGVHNVVYIATMNDSVYAFDADTAAQSAPLWQVSMGPFMPLSVCCQSKPDGIRPNIGILSTPVIDLSAGTLYLVAETYEGGNAVFRLHALDITTGADKVTPAIIQGSVPGASPDAAGGFVTFLPMMHWQRPGLLLMNGAVYIAFGSHGDDQPDHGWLFSYNSATLQQLNILCLSCGNGGSETGIWQGGVGLAGDAAGNIYLETGNGTLVANNGNFGDSVVKINGSNLTVLDYFSPSTQSTDAANDWDLGSSGPVLIPGTNLGLAGGKDGKMYVFNTTNLGGNNTTDQNAQEWQATTTYGNGIAGGFWGGNYIFYNSTMYGFGETDFLKAFAFNGSQFNTTATSQTSFIVPAGISNDPGLTISANGTTPGTGILWTAYSTFTGNQDGSGNPGILQAFDASNLALPPLWDSNQNSARDSLGSWSKWSPPIVANGKVYVATFSNVLNVYGPLSGNSTPQSLVGSGNSSSAAVNLTSEGNVDWVHWGDATLNRKAGVSPQLSDYTIIGAGTVTPFPDDPRPLSWTDGAPTATSSNNTSGDYINFLGQGFSITAPADTTSRTLTVHVGGWSSGGTLTAHLSDGSAPDYTDTTAVVGTQYDRNYTLTYAAASAGQTLSVSWVLTSGAGGNVTLEAAALQGQNIVASAGTPQTSAVSTPFATALQATVTDGQGNPLSGVTVFFTAPGSGPSGTFAGSLTANATTNASGIATAPAFTANSLAGSYTVTASAPGFNSVTYSLANTSGGAAAIAVSGGAPQTAPINTAFATPLQAMVTDSAGNPVSGATVTFTAPAGGAGGTFSGLATANAVTNASGVATAPALTANGTSGSYAVTASVAGAAATANFNLINTGVAGGALQGNGNSSTAAANLTIEGPIDWVHWGDAALNRKAGVAAQISTYAVIGAGTVSAYGDDLRTLNWTDGTPTTNSTNNRNGFYIGAGNGFSFTAPADTVGRTLTVHVGGYNSGGTLTAHLSDGSAPDFIDTTTTATGSYDRNYTLTYVSASGGQTLTVSWSMNSGSGNVTLNGAALVGGGGSIVASAGTPQSTVVSTAFATALQATVTNSAGNPVSGATVTFTAPASGATGTFGGSATATAVTNASGVATAPTFTANSQPGSYTVTASVLGAATPASFPLSNSSGSPASIVASAGTLQSTPVNTAFATALQATVTDGIGNPVSGLTVTFTAPSSGASGLFGGSSTASSVTNGNGIATAPTLTANGQTGGYTVTATLAALTANFSLTNTVALGVGSVQGTGNSLSTAVNLTTEGTVDWIHWGDNAIPNRKAGVTPQLSTFTALGTGGNLNSYNNDPRQVSWTDGTPNPTSSNNGSGEYIHNIGQGYSFTAPADSASRILIVHVGGSHSNGTLTAHLSDGSAPDYVDVSNVPDSQQYDRNYTITYNASKAGQTLTVSWVMSSGPLGGNVTLNAAALQGGSGTITPLAGTPQSTAVNTVFTTPLQVTVKDSQSNPVSGATVTFSAPSSGATATFGGSATATGVTNSSGVASAPTLTANGQTGSYTVTASVTGVGTTGSFSLTNVTGPPASIAATAGTLQTTPAGAPFATALQATVKDSGGNLVSGATVTFAAPASGPSGTFGGNTTATSVTNASGVATAPAFTANSQAGSYIVSASVAAVAPANFSLTNTGAAGGSLQGTGDNSATGSNLTTEGTADWVHWGDGALNRKAGVIPQLSDYTLVGSGTVLTYADDPRSLSWTDGTPTGANAADINGLYASGIGQGFSFTAPADTAVRTLTVHVGGSASGGTLTAHLSDGSAPDFTDVTTSGTGQYDRNYVLTYVAGTAGQTLTVTWSMTSGVSNVTLSGAALAGGSGSIVASGGTPQSTSVNTAFATALRVIVKDTGGNPINGATVTFTAPAIGASGSFGGSQTATSVTNSSGVATAPTLTANSQTGSFTVLANVAGGGTPASFSLTNTAGSVGLLAGTGNSSTTAVNLTAEGTSDWIHWGDGTPGTLNRKSGVTAQISNYTEIGTNPVLTYNNDARLMSWTDGNPTTVATNNPDGLYIHNAPNGYSFTAPADQTIRVLVVHVGGYFSGGTLTAHLSDASAADYVDITPVINASYDRNYTLSYRAGLPGQTLTVSWIMSSGTANVTLNAAALLVGGGNIAASGGTPQSTIVNANFATALQATVTDSGGNPVNGASVTFTAPGSGATGAFAGSATATAVTNASGVAIAPTLTANNQTGAYTVTATVTGAANPANFSLTNTAPVGGGSLQGTGTSVTTAVNLTTEGTADWIHWGDNTLNRKAAVTAQLTSFTVVGSGSLNTYNNDLRRMSWTDGTPTASNTNNGDGSYIQNIGQGYSFKAPADTSPRTMIVHAGGYNSGGTLTAHLSDQSAADYVDVTAAASGQYDRNYTINYSAAAAGQTLTVTWVMSSGGGNVTLSAAALQAASGTITATAGTPQSTAVSIVFATALQATVKDSGGNPVSGATVTFTTPASGASAAFGGAATASVVTNSSGVATAPALTANSQIGSYTVTAAVAGVTNPANFSLTNTAGSAASIVSSAGTPQSTGVGAAFATALQATVKDSGGNPVSGATVTFTAPSNGASAAFGGSTTASVVTNASGVAAAPALMANTQAGSYTVTAAVAGVTNPANFSLTNTSGSAANIVSGAGTPQSAVISTAFVTALQATVTDGGGNPVNGATVTFTAPSSGASAAFGGSATASVVTNASGVATAPAMTANSQAGSYTVTAKVAGVTNPANFSLTNNAGSAANITASVGTPQSTGVSTVFATALQATVKDSGGNPISGATVTFTAPSSGASAAFGGSVTASVATNASGVATAPALTANSQPGAYTVTATVAGVTNPANFSLTNTTGSAASIVSSAGTPQSTGVGAAFATALQATVKDSGGNPISGATVTFSTPSSGASAAFGGSVTASVATNASGVATAPALTANSQAGAYTVTATVAGVTNPANFSLTNTTGSAASIISSAGTPQSTGIGAAFATALQATVKDSGGNPVSGATVTFTAPSSGASAAFGGSITASVVTNASGVATAPTLTAGAQAGGYTVTAKAAGVTNPANFSLTNITGAPASIVSTAGTPQTTSVTAAFTTALQATVKDSGGNLVNGATVTFTAPSSGASATFSGSTTASVVTNASGVATAPALTANTLAGSYTVTATVTGAASPANFSLTNTAVGAGSLQGTGSSATTAVNLTTEGTTDWIHWGDNTLNRKAGVTPAQLSTYTVVGSGTVFNYNNDSRRISWTDGTPTASGTNNANGFYIQNTGQGFSFTAPASSVLRTLVVHVGGYNSGGTLTAHLSDGSAADFVDVTSAANGQFDRNYTLVYNAGSASQTLTVTWKMSSGSGNVTLNAAALSGVIVANGGTPQSATISTAFATALQATVTNLGNPVSGATVTFTAPASGATGTFGGSATASAVTNASGVATAPALTANSQAGSYSVIATVAGAANTANFSLTNTAGVVTTIVAGAGTPQSAVVSTAFATALQATVTNGGNPVSGATVTFAAPASGATALFGGLANATAVTNASGVATAPALTANSQAGSYTVTATVTGAASPANFSLTNTAVPVTTIVANAGTPQSAAVSTAFATALQATVTNGGNPVSGATVTFTAPASGATALFGGLATATAVTNASGVATAPALTANTLAGSYTVTATVTGAASPANFSLTNTAVGAGSLQGTGSSATTAVNLTTEGTTDWIHWGDNTLNRKAGVTPAQLSTYTVVGSGTVFNYNDDLRRMSWTDGAPTASGTNNGDGFYINNVGQGFSFTAPASSASRTLVVHVGGYNSGGTLTAHLSDGSAADFVDVTSAASGQYDRNYTLVYHAGATGQTLTVTWKMTSGSGNVTLNGSALH